MIKNVLAEHGKFLFRWRSYFPLLLLAPGVMAMSESSLVENEHSDLVEELWFYSGIIISIIGLAVRWLTVGYVPGNTSGRNTKEQRADVLNTKGMYSIVRNPLYLGNYLVILGILASLNVWWYVLIGSFAYWIYIERIIAAEEEFLFEKFGKEYEDWAEQTPIFFPAGGLWQNADMAFSYKTVLRREYNGLMALCTAFFVLEFLLDVVFEGDNLALWLKEETGFISVFLLTTVVFLTLRTLKKHTQVLQVAGR